MNHYHDDYDSEDIEMNDQLGVRFVTLSESAVILDVIYDKDGIPGILVYIDEDGVVDWVYLPIITLFDDEEDMDMQ